MIIHLLLENMICANGTISALFVEDNVMPNLVSQKMRLYDIICFFEEYRYAVPTLDSAIGRAQSPFARAQNPS